MKNIYTVKQGHTSVDLSLGLNLATRSCVVTGACCNNTALISSAVTGPEADVDPVLDDDAPFAVALLFEADTFSSLAEDFVS